MTAIYTLVYRATHTERGHKSTRARARLVAEAASMQPRALDDDRYYRRGRRVYDRHYIVYAASTFQVASLSWAYTRG